MSGSPRGANKVRAAFVFDRQLQNGLILLAVSAACVRSPPKLILLAVSAALREIPLASLRLGVRSCCALA